MKLGTLLLRDAVISLSQLETALRTQVLYGGRLGTNLIELGFVDVDTLGPYLAEVLSVPLAAKYHFDGAHPEAIAALPAELAELYGAFPLGFGAGTPPTLKVAMVDPRDLTAIEQLSRQCGHRIEPYVAPQLRILYHLERHYGIQRAARYVRQGTNKRARTSAEERRHTHAPHGIEMPPAVRFEPRSRKKRAGVEPTPAAPPRSRPPLSYRAACDAIDAARHRNHIADALIEFAAGRFEVAVVFLLRDANALGWRLYSAGDGSGEVIASLGLPLGGSSALQAAHDSGKPYRGPSPSAGRPVEKRLWTALGLDHEPEEMLVVPVLVKQRVVNLVYVHGFDGKAIDDDSAAELSELAVRASEAYVRLIQAAKVAARADV